MKTILSLAILTLALTFSATAQGEAKQKVKPTELDKTEAIPTESYLKRGGPIGSGKVVSLEKVMSDPTKYSGQLVRVEGVIVRSCKTEGCWAELAAHADGKGVRVKMKDHSFFIPLQSAGAHARAEGIFTVKTLTKEMVDHMIEEDGAKFPNRNADGTVTEVSFEATGIELRRSPK